jgi:succinate-semialdehyde dehydrogenase/glutarate-semialdehyde dehydrogenase
VSIRSVNPKSGELIREFDEYSDNDIERALVAAESAFAAGKAGSLSARVDCMQALAGRLDDERDSLARLITDEMGKRLAEARAEIEKCAWVCRYYAENAERMLADVVLESDATDSRVVHLPLGTLLAVMPWNFPAWQVFRAAVPAIMAGNVVLLKHASNVPGTALRLATLFEAAGFEAGVFQTLLIGPERVEDLLADRRVNAVTVTGSTAAGSAVAATAGRNLKKTVLELGGSDPFIVLPSADLDAALDTATTARMLNNGQSCIAAKRFIVHADVYDRFMNGFVERFEALTVGDPLEASTDVGPMAMKRLRERLLGQVEKLIAGGATRLTGADTVDGPGYFFRPGIISGLPAGAEPFDEELFGPVAWVLKAASFDEALSLANATQYGLGSSVWTQEQTEIERVRHELDCGATFINAMVKSDPRLPFGGIRNSGYGRELARDGIVEFVNRKTFVIAHQ